MTRGQKISRALKRYYAQKRKLARQVASSVRRQARRKGSA